MNKNAVLGLLLAAVEGGEPVALLTAVGAEGVYAGQLGRHLVVWSASERSPEGDLQLGDVAVQALSDARHALREHSQGQHTYATATGKLAIFVEVEAPQPHLIIAGAGHIAVPLAAIAHICDFEVTVLDDRPQYANRKRFPTADGVVDGPFRAELRALRRGRRTFGANTYIVLVTRGHQYDVECLLEVLDDPLAYIGMIGSQRRIRAVYELLEREQSIPPEKFDRIYAPVGLAIGAQTPAEIALCIMAEIVNVRRGGPALSLSEQMRREQAERRQRINTHSAQNEVGNP